MIRITDQYFWNVIFSLFFLVLLYTGGVILESEARMPIGELSVFDITLIVLATFRLIRLFVYDAVSKFFREQFWDIEKTKDGYYLTKPKSGPRRTLADLTTCPWCMGLWMAAFTTFCYLWSEMLSLLVLVLAIASVASLLQITANYIGWNAEKAKRDAGG